MTFFIDQHGCAKNQIDGELIAAALETKGWTLDAEPDNADLLIINSCGFIEDAKRESLEAVIGARAAYPKAKILLAGCLAQRYAADFVESLPEADGFFGNGDLSKIDDVLSSLYPATGKSSTRPVIVPPDNGVCCGNRTRFFNFPGSAYIKITEGCDNCCSFCAIPLIRGHLRSRPLADIVDEVSALAARGIKEFNLIGQDLASYGIDFNDTPRSCEAIPRGQQASHSGTSQLSSLLKALSAIPGTFWIRLLYIHPDNFPRDILPIIAADERIVSYFDIPFQNGAESVLTRMNRHGTAKKYSELVTAIRKSLPNAALRTTFLVGFPGERDEDFEETKTFLQDIKPLWSGSFTYSKEDNTPAASLKGRVAKKIATARKDSLAAIQQNITENALQQYVGRTVTVLVEELIVSATNNENASDDAGELLALGRAWFQAPEVDGSVVLSYNETQHIEPGMFVRAKIYAVTGVDVSASVLD